MMKTSLPKADKKSAFKLLITLMIATVITAGCKKAANVSNPQQLTKAVAKEWYYGTFKKSKLFSDFQRVTKIQRNPSWNLAFEQQFGEYKIVELPLNSSIKSVPVNKELSEVEKKRIVGASFERLLIASDQKGNISLTIATYLPSDAYLKRHNYDASSNIITKLTSDFEGRILITDWNGQFVNGFKYKNGKVVNRMTGKMSRKTDDYTLKIDSKTEKGNSAKISTNGISQYKVASSQTCTWTYEDTYSVTSVGHTEGDVVVIDEITITYEGTDSWEFQGCVDDDTNEPEEPEDPIDPCDFGFCDPWQITTPASEYTEPPSPPNVKLCQNFNWTSNVGNSYYAQASNLAWAAQGYINGNLANLTIEWSKSCIQLPNYNIANGAAASAVFNTAFNLATTQLLQDINSNHWWTNPILAKARLKLLINTYLNIAAPGSTFSSDVCSGNIASTQIGYNSYCK